MTNENTLAADVIKFFKDNPTVRPIRHRYQQTDNFGKIECACAAGALRELQKINGDERIANLYDVSSDFLYGVINGWDDKPIYDVNQVKGRNVGRQLWSDVCKMRGVKVSHGYCYVCAATDDQGDPNNWVHDIWTPKGDELYLRKFVLDGCTHRLFLLPDGNYLAQTVTATGGEGAP